MPKCLMKFKQTGPSRLFAQYYNSQILFLAYISGKIFKITQSKKYSVKFG